MEDRAAEGKTGISLFIGFLAVVAGSVMELERIEARTRDEYRGAQEPVRFVWRGREYRIARVIDRWYEGSVDATRLPLRYFKVESQEGRTFLLRYHELFRAWAIVLPKDESETE